jgi:uncharacterized protein YkwD
VASRTARLVQLAHFAPLFFVALSACGGVPAAVEAPASVPEQPPAHAAAYGGDAGSAQLTPAEAAIVARLERDGPLGCAIDPRLIRAARRHAAALASATKAPGEAEMDHLRFAVLAEGGADYQLAPFAVRGLASGEPALRAYVEEHRREITHCGIGTARAGDRDVAVWVGSRRTVDLEPVPAASEIGARLTVKGVAMGAADGAIQAFLGLPDGSVRRLDVEALGAGRFAVPLRLERAGRYELELQVDLGGGAETASLLPLYAGTQPDSRPTIAAKGADAEPSSTEAPDAQIFTLVNAARERLGVAKLVRDARLDRVALTHSADMVALGYFGHRSPSGAMLADRLRATGLRPTAFGENVARSSSASRVHRNLMSSPSHRMELLSSSYTHLGVGVTRDGDDLVVTEVLARW